MLAVPIGNIHYNWEQLKFCICMYTAPKYKNTAYYALFTCLGVRPPKELVQRKWILNLSLLSPPLSTGASINPFKSEMYSVNATETSPTWLLWLDNNSNSLRRTVFKVLGKNTKNYFNTFSIAIITAYFVSSTVSLGGFSVGKRMSNFIALDALIGLRWNQCAMLL